MPKQTTPAMEAHIAQELTTLSDCIYIEQENGRTIRMTSHDRNITVGGEVYFSNIGFVLSAIESTAGLAVDNASIRVGVDGAVFSRDDFANGRMIDAKFGIFTTNWQAPDDGVIWLKKGFVGKTQWSETKNEASMELLGMTAAFSGKSIEQYSPTCRANLGDVRCSFCNIPNRIHSGLEQYTTGNYFLKPASQNAAVITNGSWESDGVVPMGITGITGWQRTPGSSWEVSNANQALGGSYYVQTEVSSNTSRLWQTFSTSSVGIPSSDIIAGEVMINVTCGLTPTTNVRKDMGKAYIYVEALDVVGTTLQHVKSRVIDSSNNISEGVWLTVSAPIMLHPDTKSLRVGIHAGPNSRYAFDDMNVSWFTHNSRASFSNTTRKTVKIFNGTGFIDPSSSLNLQNNKFSKDGVTPNTVEGTNITNWSSDTSSYWLTSSALGALVPEFGQTMLVAGDDGSSMGDRVYTITQRRSAEKLGMDDTDIANGWWYSESVVWFSNVNTSDSTLRVRMVYYDTVGQEISAIETDELTSDLVNQWDSKPVRLGGRVPVGTLEVEIQILVTTGPATSAGDMAIDMAELAVYPVAYEGELDPEWGRLALTDTTYDDTPKSFTVDGEMLVQAEPLTFGYGQVTAGVTERSFTTADIDYTPVELYSGVIYWLTGANASQNSIIRLFDAGTGTISLYRNLAQTPSIGDKFIFAKGCDKTIDTCADRFNNAINFRGEPYLPGTANIIEFLTQN